VTETSSLPSAGLSYSLRAAMAHAMGAPRTVMVSGVACILGSVWFVSQMKTVRKAMRPIYEELGILPAANIGPLEDVAGK